MKAHVALALCLLPSGPLAAQGWIEGRNPDMTGVARLRTAVSVRVVGRIARVSVEEWFENRGTRVAEGDYLYPLTGEAVFSSFTLYQGDQALRGETMDAAQARSIYEAIVRKRRDPALIELVGHGLIRARVFPIEPGKSRRITLRYTQLMDRAGEALQFRYAAGGRFSHVPQGQERTGRRQQPTPGPIAFELTADSGAAFSDPFSPTHGLDVDRDGGQLVVRLTEPLAGDLSLFLPLARDAIGLTAVFHRPSRENGYFMLTLSPGAVRTEATQRRDVTAVVDVSGSMSGTKIAQARSALRGLLGSLGPDDRFRLIAFNNRVRTYRQGWTPATDRQVATAAQWIDDLDADGGTNLAGALSEAFAVESPERRLSVVVFLTDGLPSVGEQNPERIADRAERARRQARVFAFGVGYDVNTYLLDRLSSAGRGATQYVQPGEDVEAVVGHLVRKISRPVLVDLELGGAASRFREVYPARLPDLFADEELVIFGRYVSGRSGAPGEVVVTGRRNGQEERFAVRLRFPDHETGNAYVPRLWAARKIGVLSRSVRLGGATAELVEDIRKTALRYGLLSEYTSYLVQEPERQPGPLAGLRALPSTPLNAATASPPVGRGAVIAADRARKQREAKTVSDVAAAEETLLEQAGKGEATRRAVAGRLFTERDGVWTDMRHRDTTRVVEVSPFSDAYFKLLALLPELRPYATLFDRVLISGERVAIAIGPDGRSRLSATKLRGLVTAFRGS